MCTMCQSFSHFFLLFPYHFALTKLATSSQTVNVLRNHRNVEIGDAITVIKENAEKHVIGV